MTILKRTSSLFHLCFIYWYCITGSGLGERSCSRTREKSSERNGSKSF